MMRRTPMARGAGFKRPTYTPRPQREQDDTPSTAPARPRMASAARMSLCTSHAAPIDKENALTLERLKELFEYKPDTGAFIRKVQAGPKMVGEHAGAINANGYRQISIDGRLYYAHRLAWLYMHGQWPDDQIDHKDGVRDNNRLNNLRQATNAQNCQNSDHSLSGTSGVVGVSWSKQFGKWRAYIGVDGRQVSLGYFDSKDEAEQSRSDAEKQLHTFKNTSRTKKRPVQNARYMNLVRALPCAHCGKPPRSVFCHSDEGKGMAIKSDCRQGWPGCPECHDAIGTQRIYPKEQRRALEADMARRTRALIEASGQWPKSLPKLPS